MTRKIEDLKRLNNDRVDYSKISGDLPLPNLVEIQTKSFEEFKQKGLEEVFKEAFPIKNYTETLTIDFVSVSIGEPKHSYIECKTRDLSYDAPIHILSVFASLRNRHILPIPTALKGRVHREQTLVARVPGSPNIEVVR